MPVFTLRELREKYDRFARWYDALEGLLEWLGLARLRRRLLVRTESPVLEIAAGTGNNFRHYPRGTRVLAVDVSEGMLRRAKRRAKHLRLVAQFAFMDAQQLAVPDASFQTVVSSLATCTFPDPVAVLREMRRVCRPGGRILLLEHGRSDRPRLAAFQDRHAETLARHLGCHWNRDTLGLIREAGLQPCAARRVSFGCVHVIEIARAH